MAIILIALFSLTAVLWFLVKLREFRETPLEGVMPNDEATLLLGLFYALSHACILYFKERSRYPALITGARDGLVELGFLKENLLPEGGHGLVPMFSMVANEDVGYGICLFNTSPSLANDILERAEKNTHGRLRFFHFKDNKFEPVAAPVKEIVNLSLILPSRPR
ncbi:MAG: hypothetical protein HQL51_13925 [Magnetococcales bacterium]|nr:hypothetical protein [Magnetococcales bacterium]